MLNIDINLRENGVSLALYAEGNINIINILVPTNGWPVLMVRRENNIFYSEQWYGSCEEMRTRLVYLLSRYELPALQDRDWEALWAAMSS